MVGCGKMKNKSKKVDGLVKHYFNYLKQETASVATIAAFALPLFVGMAGLGTDTGIWMSDKRNLQMAADAAVMAAGWELAQENEYEMDPAALREAKNNGYNPNANGYYNFENLGSDGEVTRLGVTLKHDSRTFFSRIIFKDPIQVAAYAEAIVGEPDGQFCILALEEFDQGSLTTSGTVDIDSPACGIAVNSSNDRAMIINGNVDILVNNVQITGDYDIVGGSANFQYNSMKTGRKPVVNPYEDLEVPEFEGCDERNLKLTKNATLSPGVYCGGIDITGTNDIVLEPGTYIMDGGDFNVSGGGSITGDGVTIILTGQGNKYGQVDISGGKTVDISAPLAGNDFAGIVFFQDPDAPTNGNTSNKITGSSDVMIDGVAYFPSQDLEFGGTTDVLGADSPCTKLIAKNVSLAGTPRLGNECDPYDVREIGRPLVRLVR